MARSTENQQVRAPRKTRGAALDEDVPYGMRIAAEWSWRFLAVIAAAAVVIWLLAQVSFLVIPLMLAVLLSALLTPVVEWLARHRLHRGIAVALTLLGSIALVVVTLIFVGNEAVKGFRELWADTLEGIRQVQGWLQTGPLQLTTDKIDEYLKSIVSALQGQSSAILNGALNVGSSAGHIATGLLLTLFILIFFLLEGRQIWNFVTRFAPIKARPAIHGAGMKAWDSVGNYVRVQVFVAAVDAVGIGVGAAIIGVPLALPLGLLVFLGSFIPVVGALVTGAIAVLLALVANGWINAVIMLVIVLAVQQLESHVLQPLIMGKAVSLHPVGVILAVAAGSFLAGIPGALFAVPALAAANAFIRFIASRGWEKEPLTTAGTTAEGELTEEGQTPPSSPDSVNEQTPEADASAAEKPNRSTKEHDGDQD